MLTHVLSMCVVGVSDCEYPLQARTPPPVTLTDEEDRKGDEEQKYVGHHIERVQEAAIV